MVSVLHTVKIPSYIAAADPEESNGSQTMLWRHGLMSVRDNPRGCLHDLPSDWNGMCGNQDSTDLAGMLYVERWNPAHGMHAGFND